MTNHLQCLSQLTLIAKAGYSFVNLNYISCLFIVAIICVPTHLTISHDINKLFTACNNSNLSVTMVYWCMTVIFYWLDTIFGRSVIIANC